MKHTGIITDSHSGIGAEEAERLGIKVLPMPFYFNNECHYEGVDLSREDFFMLLDSGVKVMTSQPSPEEVMNAWDEGLEEYEEIVYIPISSGLSGSCSTAMMLAMQEPYDGRVFVVDNGRVATPLHRSVLDALEMIEAGRDGEYIKASLEKSRGDMVIYIGLDTLTHLKNGGRIKPGAALLGNILNIKPILKFDTGILDAFKKCRGYAKMKKELILAMKNDLETVFKDRFEKGEVNLLVASSAEKDITEGFLNEVREAFPGMAVMCDDLAMAICCHIGHGGLGIGCSCKPEM